MDPITGLLGLTSLSIGSLAFLHWKKQQSEGFETVDAENYPATVSDSQTVYNPLSQLMNPFMNGLLSVNPSQNERRIVSDTTRQALIGVEGDYSLNNSETLNAQISRYFTEPRVDKDGGLLETIQFCREEGKKQDPFANPRFTKTCGMCLTDGTDEEGGSFTGKRGLFIYEKEKDAALKAKEQTGDLYAKGKPSLGMCTGAPDQPVFALNKKEYDLFLKRNECQTNKVVGDGCGVCLDSKTYSYMDKSTEKESIFLVLAGLGKVTVKINAKVIDREDVPLQETTPIKFDLGSEEGSRFEIIVKKDPKAVLYGYLEAMLPNRGVFRIQLRKLVTNDEETGSSPATEPPAYRFKGTSIVATKMKNANTKDQLRVSGILPFSFPSPGEFSTLDCPSTPFQSKKESLSAISADPCANKTSMGGYSDECLLEKIYDAGCTNNGTLAQNPAQVNQYGSTLEAIVSRLQTIKSKDGVTVLDSQLCTGSNPKTPCEEALLNPSAPISAECLLYLYRNRGLEDNRIGATYVGNESLASKQADGTLQYCLPSGSLSPIAINGTPNQQSVNALNQRALQGFGGATGLKAVQAFLNSIFVQATDSTKRTDEPSRAVAIQQCFQNVANLPTPGLAAVTRSIAGSLWITGADGYIHKYQNGGFVRQSQLASQIAVTKENTPWYLTSGYGIYRPTGTTYVNVPGAAVDIGVGANNGVWVIGTNREGGGYGIYKWVETGWQKISGSAVRIAVNPSGNAWVINIFDQVFEWKGTWWNYTDAVSGKDIAVSPNNTVVVLQPTKLQIKKSSDTNWTSLDGPQAKTMLRVAIDSNDFPYVTTSDKKLYQYNGTLWYEIPTPALGIIDVGLGTV